MTRIATLITTALLLTATAAAADTLQPLDALYPATTDSVQTVLASLTVSNPADQVYYP